MTIAEDVKGFITNLTSDRKVESTTQASQTAKKNDPNLIQIPGDFFPHANFGWDALWVKITARQLLSQKTRSRGGSLQIGKKGTTFKFLAPPQIVDVHNHNWEEYASIQSRFLQLVINAKIAADQGGQIVGDLKRQFFQALSKIKKNISENRAARAAGKPPVHPVSFPGVSSLANTLYQTATQAADVAVPKYKQDTPLKYTGSSRRTYNLPFILADSKGGETVERAVNLLQSYAAAESVSEYEINFPFIFEVQTEPFGLLKLNYAALESVLVTWNAPYRRGRGTWCELQLQFKDMSPLFRKTIEKGSIVKVNVPPEIKKEQTLEQARLDRANKAFQEQYQRNARNFEG